MYFLSVFFIKFKCQFLSKSSFYNQVTYYILFNHYMLQLMIYHVVLFNQVTVCLLTVIRGLLGDSMALGNINSLTISY